MPLAGKTWTPITIYKVVAEFLRSERLWLPEQYSKNAWMIDRPDLTDALQNRIRLQMLYHMRRWVLGEIPPDTQWFEVHSLTACDLDELHVIARCGWDDPADQNELIKVAARKPTKMSSPPSEWAPPILWGHDRNGPFTIIEGNHRLLGYVSASPQPDLAVTVIIGLSPMHCNFHFADPDGTVAYDFWLAPAG